MCDVGDFIHLSDTDMRIHDTWANGSWHNDLLQTTLFLLLQTVISKTPIPSLGECLDRRVWKAQPPGEFNVSSAYRWHNDIQPTGDANDYWLWSWKTKAPQKILFLASLVLYLTVPTNSFRHH